MQRVVTGLALEPVVAAETRGHIVPGSGQQHIGKVAPGDIVVVVSGRDVLDLGERVAAFADGGAQREVDDQIRRPALEHDRIEARSADQRLVAGAADEGIIAFIAVNGVLAAASVQHIVARAAMKLVVARAAADEIGQMVAPCLLTPVPVEHDILDA